MDRTSIGQTAPVINEVQRRSDMLVRTLPISLLPVFGGLLSGLFIRFLLGGMPESAPPTTHKGTELLVGLAVAVDTFTALILLARLGRPTISAVYYQRLGARHHIGYGRKRRDNVLAGAADHAICAAGLLLDGVASATLALLDTLLVAVSAGIQRQELSEGIGQSALFMTTNRPIFAAGFWIAVFWASPR